jgi:hypothetical protein
MVSSFARLRAANRRERLRRRHRQRQFAASSSGAEPWQVVPVSQAGALRATPAAETTATISRRGGIADAGAPRPQ